jgi:biopolymer transport protein ExbD
MWESGWSRGGTSDWFVFYGNIFGSLIGGFFTFIALLLTLKNQDESKKQEKRPRLDIPHQSIEFIEPDDHSKYNKPILIEINNVGGSIAKNIEVTLILKEFDETISALHKSKDDYKIDLIASKTVNIDDFKEIETKGSRGVGLIVRHEDGEMITSLGTVYPEYSAEFIGSCFPMMLNHQAKALYGLNLNVSKWINYIVINRKYPQTLFNEKELFSLELKVKYSSDEYGDFTDYFKIDWNFIGMWYEDSIFKFQYVLKSIKINK